MKIYTKLAGVTAALALTAAPAFALPAQVPSNPGMAYAPITTPAGPPSSTPGPSAGLPTKAKAYGRYCKDQSKKRVEGQKGTPFSKCVTAMAKLASGSTKSPRTACKTESKKHVEGQKGTPFSKCVSAGAKLLRDQAANE